MAVTNVSFKIDKIKDAEYANRWTKKFIHEWNDVYLNVDGMDMEVYDEKSDCDNPFIEPLFNLQIYKSKVQQLSECSLKVKTKFMKFSLQTDSEAERDEWIEKFGRCNVEPQSKLSNLLTTIRASMESLVVNQLSRRRSRTTTVNETVEPT